MGQHGFVGLTLRHSSVVWVAFVSPCCSELGPPWKWPLGMFSWNRLMGQRHSGWWPDLSELVARKQVRVPDSCSNKPLWNINSAKPSWHITSWILDPNPRNTTEARMGAWGSRVKYASAARREVATKKHAWDARLYLNGRITVWRNHTHKDENQLFLQTTIIVGGKNEFEIMAKWNKTRIGVWKEVLKNTKSSNKGKLLLKKHFSMVDKIQDVCWLAAHCLLRSTRPPMAMPPATIATWKRAPAMPIAPASANPGAQRLGQETRTLANGKSMSNSMIFTGEARRPMMRMENGLCFWTETNN